MPRNYRKSGLILLDSTLVPLFINSHGQDLLDVFSPANHPVHGAIHQRLYKLPKVIHGFARDLRTWSKMQLKSRIPDPPLFSRLLKGPDEGLLLRGKLCALSDQGRDTYYLITATAIRDEWLMEPGLLTPREVEVAGLSARGYTAKKIAEKLKISVHTVYDHFKVIRVKSLKKKTV